MTKKVSYAITDNNVTVNYDGQTHIVARTDALADKLIKALREGKTAEIPNLVSASKRIESFSNGKFVVKDGHILVNGQVAPAVLGNKIVKFSNEGLPYQPLVKFAENLQKNPSFRAVNELFTFLEKNDHPITEEGNFIAYKRVRGNFKDIHSNTFDNSVGVTVEMPRNQVNENANETCSNGLHVANWTYAHTQFASNDSMTDIMLEVEVNPSDVVSVPVDYLNAKIRVCKYKVLGVVDKAHSSEVSLCYTSNNSNHCSNDSNHCLNDEDEETFCDVCGEETYDGDDICEDCLDEEEDDDYPFENETK